MQRFLVQHKDSEKNKHKTVKDTVYEKYSIQKDPWLQLETGAELLALPFLQRALSYHPCGLRGDSNPGHCKTYGDYRMRLYWQEWPGTELPETVTFPNVHDFIRQNPNLVIWTAAEKTCTLRDSKRPKTQANFDQSLLRGTPLRGLEQPSLSLKTKLKFPLGKALQHVKKERERQEHLQRVQQALQEQPPQALDQMATAQQLLALSDDQHRPEQQQQKEQAHVQAI